MPFLSPLTLILFYSGLCFERKEVELSSCIIAEGGAFFWAGNMQLLIQKILQSIVLHNCILHLMNWCLFEIWLTSRESLFNLTNLIFNLLDEGHVTVVSYPSLKLVFRKVESLLISRYFEKALLWHRYFVHWFSSHWLLIWILCCRSTSHFFFFVQISRPNVRCPEFMIKPIFKRMMYNHWWKWL